MRAVMRYLNKEGKMDALHNKVLSKSNRNNFWLNYKSKAPGAAYRIVEGQRAGSQLIFEECRGTSTELG